MFDMSYDILFAITNASSYVRMSLAGWLQPNTLATIMTVQEYHPVFMMFNDKPRNAAQTYGDVCAMFH